MKTLLVITMLATVCAACFGEAPSRNECITLSNAAARYNSRRDTNLLQVVEDFYRKFPNSSNMAISMIKADDNTVPLFIRLLKETPESSSFRAIVLTALRFASESDELLKLFVETALNPKESEDARLSVIFSLMEGRWTKAQPALTEIYLKMKEEKYHERMLDVAIYRKSRPMAEVFLSYYHHFHPEKEHTYRRHYTRFQEMKAKLAEDAKNPQPDPLALIRAQREWWDKFIKKERKISLEQAKAGLADFAKAPVLDRLDLVYAIQQSGVGDADLVKRMDHLVSNEPSGIVKMALITIVATHQPTTQAMLQYYRRMAAKEKDAEVLSNVQARIKLIEDGVLKR